MHRFIFCLNYMVFPLVLYPPPSSEATVRLYEGHLPQLSCPCPVTLQFQTVLKWATSQQLSCLLSSSFICYYYPTSTIGDKLSTSSGTWIVIKTKLSRFRGIYEVKNRKKDTASSENLVSTNSAQANPQKGTEPGVPKGKRSLLTCHTRCKSSMENTRSSVKVGLGIKVMKLVKSLIGLKVTVTGRGSECHLTFVRGRLA